MPTSGEAGDGNADGEIEQAIDVNGNAGACPPFLIEYRVYPVKDFSALFGDKPNNVN